MMFNQNLGKIVDFRHQDEQNKMQDKFLFTSSKKKQKNYKKFPKRIE